MEVLSKSLEAAQSGHNINLKELRKLVEDLSDFASTKEGGLYLLHEIIHLANRVDCCNRVSAA